ncbi:RNA polymerase subunit sigma [Paenibacillus agaridevorans]|uniref:RNA polymerase subunit sigma n=1 Tax=Paenibacillus agaridevorans TaxID=171404 RepID=A0A2R5ELM7_9BACL|nr:sigma-70 family RNA polymerase sigma factor [Paenibacillus agaridevorans]GBG07542.1 RNA polymerase subunit sigma [Paenibacillus agaridevorans]
MRPAGSNSYENENIPRDPDAALELLMNRFGSTVMRTAYFYTGDRHLAEDISQETFLRAYRKWTSFRGDSSVQTWLTTITVNVCRDKMGVRMFAEQPTDPVRMDRGRTISVEEEALEKFEKSEVLRYVLQLSMPYQEALYLYYYLDLGTKEIAEAIGVPEGTVRNRLHRAREALAKEMKKEEYGR